MLAFIDLDGVVANSIKRFEQAQKAVYDAGKVSDPNLYWSVAFDPELVELDEPIQGAKEALDTLEKKYRIIFLTSRPQSMEYASMKWLDEHNMLLARNVICKAPAFQYTKTQVWKIGIIQQIVPIIDPGEDILFVDDELVIRAEEVKEALSMFDLKLFGSLAEVVNYA